MSRFIAIGILRRDIFVLATTDNGEDAATLAEDSVRQGQMNEAGVIEAAAWFTQVTTPVAPPSQALPPVAPAPLNLSPHRGGLDTAQVVGGPYLNDVNAAPNVSGRQIEGRADVIEGSEQAIVEEEIDPDAAGSRMVNSETGT